MPSTYTGDPAGAADDRPTVALPVDGDGRNAESVNVVFRELADYLAYLQNKWHPIVSASAAELRVLVQAIDDEEGVGLGIRTRIYVNTDGETEIVRNARWLAAPTNKWQADHWNAAWGPQICSKHVFSNSGIVSYSYGDAAHDLTNPTYAWADSAWADKVRLNSNGLIRFFDTLDGGANNSNPDPGEAQKNTLCAKNLPKAIGLVRWNAGTVTVVDGFNVDPTGTISLGTPPRGISVAFPAGGLMHDANYSVACTVRAVTTLGGTPRFASPATSGFDLVIVDAAGDPVDITGADIYFAFQVFGRQDS